MSIGQSIKGRIKAIPLMESYLKRKEIARWKLEGRPIPPPDSYKQMAVLNTATTFGLDTLVETGTYMGDMIWAQKDFFRKIYSIELSPELYSRAQKRFAGVKNVKLVFGDSSVKLKEIVAGLKEPALFWLDGHFSGGITAKGDTECPIYDELEQVLESDLVHSVMIDDARLFVGANDYPTLAEIESFMSERSAYKMTVANDIIFLNLPASELAE
jgi:hypothetical protein